MKKIYKYLIIAAASLVIIIAGGLGILYTFGLSGMSSISEPKEGQIRVACVGDSITYGHGIKNWKKNNYPAVLARELGNKYHVNNYGVSGYTVQEDGDRPYVSLKQYQDSLTYNPDIVVFMMGTNDSKPFNWESAGAFRSDLENLLYSYEEIGAKIILCTPATAFFLEETTSSETSFNIQPEVVEIIAAIVRGVASQHNYTLIDINDFTENHAEWFGDGVHPNNEGAKAIAQEIAKYIK